jgi:uncharacterized membrane protein YeaQ/YmgE (transglycosylase-associated protein family)
MAAQARARHAAVNSERTKEDIMGVIGWIVLGLGAGAIARAIHKGDEPGGVLGTLVVGVLGALLGGLLASLVGLGGISSFFSIGTWLVAVVGAFLLLWVYSTLVHGDPRSAPREA